MDKIENLFKKNIDPVLEQYAELTVNYRKYILDKTKKLRGTIKEIVQKNKIILSGQLAYDIYMAENEKTANDVFNNEALLTFFLYGRQQNLVFNHGLYKDSIDFSELMTDDFSRRIKFFIPHTGIVNPHSEDVAKFFILQDNVVVRTEEHFGFTLVSPDYLFIEWYNDVCQPREIRSLEKWAQIYEKNDKFIDKYYMQKEKDSHQKILGLNHPQKLIEELQHFIQKSKDLIETGDLGISILINNGEMPSNYNSFRNFKVLSISKNIAEISGAIHSITKKYGYRYTPGKGFLMRFHGPETVFYHEKHGVILRLFQTSEQCIPYFEYHGYRIGRLPGLLKYLFLEDPTEVREALVIKLFTSQRAYYEKNKLTPFDSSIYQFYDTDCLGIYISATRKKRINLFRKKIESVLNPEKNKNHKKHHRRRASADDNSELSDTNISSISSDCDIDNDYDCNTYIDKLLQKH